MAQEFISGLTIGVQMSILLLCLTSLTYPKLIHPLWFHTDAKEWDVTKLKELLDDDHLQLILATPISSHPMSDSVCWGFLGNGDFSAKTATWAAHGLDIKNSPSWEYSWI